MRSNGGGGSYIFSEKAIHFDHSIDSGLGPPILFDDSVDLFTENGCMFRLSNEMIQYMRKVLDHCSVEIHADDTKGRLTSEAVWIAEKLTWRMRATRSSTVRRAGRTSSMSHEVMSF
jgi:hypothetical protein